MAEPALNLGNKNAANQERLCPFYGSSHGCPNKHECQLSHANADSITLCPQYQTLAGCRNPDLCYYRHSLPPLNTDELHKLAKKHKIPGRIHYVRVMKGKAVRRVILIINQVVWYAIHFVVEDDRMQRIHHQKYSSIYLWKDALLVSEIIGEIVLKSESPGKYLSYLKNLIDGDAGPDKHDRGSDNHPPLIHFRDVLRSIGNNYHEIPKPMNPHLLKNFSRVPWTDFRLFSLPDDVYDLPDIFLKPGDLVRVWRPKKFIHHTGIYVGDNQIIHVSNGVARDDGMSWKHSLFQSGSGSAPPKHVRVNITEKQQTDMKHAPKETSDRQDDDDDDDMDLVDSDSDNALNVDEEKNICCETFVALDGESDQKFPDHRAESDNVLLCASIDALEQDEDAVAGAGDVVVMSAAEMEYARRARQCDWKEFLGASRKKDLELGFFIFPWRTPSAVVYTAQFLTEIHYMKGKYSVLKNNCEHFALYCCTGLRYSPQANRLNNIVEFGSKVSSLVGSLRSMMFAKTKPEQPSESENEGHKNHPIIHPEMLEMDDGGDDELEKMLDERMEQKLKQRRANNSKKSKTGKRLQKPKKKHQARVSKMLKENEKMDGVRDEHVLDDDDEYADDEDMLVEDNDVNVDAFEDMTPCGMTSSEILVAQKHFHQQPNTWNM
eukprot:CAMPEP_0202697332 /NCGR_PEP_ID=MMETSP1385-20130828/10659_1 /ASSEMBLY_ACC=CAM_ASM_000861 /TAXON_ID=933848 /ORGANISM="Elphidium margaritaceum" /LENGTH=661 /DNA_ID=CAMNT_0049353767 /DNA_START=16 /DNA_END=2001 /DNA_ORIENTATION=-